VRSHRRQFVALLAGAAVASLVSPLAARAQDGRVRRIGWFSSLPENDLYSKARIAAFRVGLRKLGWVDGRNVQLDCRWGDGDVSHLQPLAVDLIRSAPDVIVAVAGTALSTLSRDSTTIPIVFAQVPDPMASGYVSSLSRPGGHITGFALFEFAVGVKWLELLKELAPGTRRVALVYDPANSNAPKFRDTIASSAASFGVQITSASLRDGAEFERTLASFAGEPNGGLIVLPGPATAIHRDLTIALAAKFKLPAVYPYRYHVDSGGLAYYGIDEVDLYRQAASYVDRILKGERPGDLPIQFPTKFELVINLKTAKAFGIEPPIPLLARTDEVIE